jgi:hypothetical protein
VTRRLSSLVFGLSLSLVPVTAAAQEPAPSAPPSAPAPSAVSPEAKEQARLHFAAGVNLLKDPEKARYEEAYIEFKKAYELVGSPSILGNIGLCAMKLERDADAIAAYSKYLAEMTTLDPEEKAQTERDLATLKAGLARVNIETVPDGAIINDARIHARGESVLNIYGPLKGKTELGVRRGHHIFKARFPDGREVVWETDIAGGEEHTFEEPPAPVNDHPMTQTGRPVPSSVYIGAAASAGLGIGTIVVGLLAVNAKSKYNTANDGTDASHATDLRGSAQTLNVVTDVLLGLTVVGAAVTTYLYLSRPTVTSTNAATLTRVLSSQGVIRF